MEVDDSGQEIVSDGGHYTPPELNPWVSIWTQPRATIQQIVDSDPEQSVLILAGLGGFADCLSLVLGSGLGDRYSWFYIVLLCGLIGLVWGIVTLYVFSFLLHWTGKWLDGMASQPLIRAAGAWAQVPIMWSFPIWVPLIALFGQDLFRSGSFGLESNPFYPYYGPILAPLAVLGVWSFVLSLHCLAQVQGFSAWKALGNNFLAVFFLLLGAAVTVIFIALLTISAMFVGSFLM
ncbi:MAG: Yip1 family protein [Acidobacteriota bacterium]|jgi:hypothetical protein|nr:Yip1 family protein [Acidobacteriota bacterium]